MGTNVWLYVARMEDILWMQETSKDTFGKLGNS